jgi:hypothetical protein
MIRRASSIRALPRAESVLSLTMNRPVGRAYSGREPDTCARWLNAAVFSKPASTEEIVNSLARLLHPTDPPGGSSA